MNLIRPSLPPLEVVRLVSKALDSKKAEDIRVLDVSEQSSITDYLVMATGNSEPHLRALRVELEKELDAAGIRIIGMDTEQGSGWMVVDAFDVMTHIFTRQTREAYALEKLWKDAVEVSVPRLLKGESIEKAPKKPKAPKAAKTAAKAKTGKSAKAPVKKAAAKSKPAKAKTSKVAATKAKKSLKKPAKKTPARAKKS